MQEIPPARRAREDEVGGNEEEGADVGDEGREEKAPAATEADGAVDEQL